MFSIDSRGWIKPYADDTCPTNDVTHSFISATKSNWHISVYMVYGDREIKIWKKKLQKSLDENMNDLN